MKPSSSFFAQAITSSFNCLWAGYPHLAHSELAATLYQSVPTLVAGGSQADAPVSIFSASRRLGPVRLVASTGPIC